MDQHRGRYHTGYNEEDVANADIRNLFEFGLQFEDMNQRNSRLGWMIAGGVALATLIGFSLTRTVGLPQSKDDIGNWLEPMGLAALFIEACVVMLAGYGLGINRLTNANRTGQISVRSTF